MFCHSTCRAEQRAAEAAAEAEELRNALAAKEAAGALLQGQLAQLQVCFLGTRCAPVILGLCTTQFNLVAIDSWVRHLQLGKAPSCHSK